MKKILSVLLLSVLLFSCSADSGEDLTTQVNGSNMPTRFLGKWESYGLYINRIAEFTPNSIYIETHNDIVTKTQWVTILDNGSTYYEARLSESERLVILHNAVDISTPDDDILTISLYENEESVISAFYYRKFN